MKPHLGFYQCVDSSHSLRKFSFKKYKHFSKLKITKPSVNINQNQQFSIITKLSSSTKSLKHLNLSQYNLENCCLSQLKLVAKKLFKITRLSLVGGSKKSLSLAQLMLKKPSSLRHLSLQHIFDVSSCQQLLRSMTRSKLKTIDLIPIFAVKYEPKWLLSFSSYCPSTVQELSLYWKDQIDGSRLKLSKKHLANLQKLELGIPLALNTFTNIVTSISDPSKLKSLQFQLERSKIEGLYLPDVQAFFGKCSNLEELDLKTDLDVYPMNSSFMKLRKFSVELNEGHLRIINFIQQQKDSLESLSLTTKNWKPNLTDGVLKELKSLKKLKKLKLNLKSDACFIKALALVELIKALECLEEVDFMDSLIEFKKGDFYNFWKALQKRSGCLRSLRLSLNAFKMDKNHSRIIIQTLMLLSRLEHLTLKDFTIEDPSFYIDLRELICFKNRRLNEVILDEVKRVKTKACCEILIQMLKAIIRKPSMKKFCYVEAKKYWFAFDFKGLEILSLSEDVLKEVHHFNSLHLPSYTCKPPFSSVDFNSQKW